MNPLVIQVIGFIGLLFVVLSFQKDKRDSILLFLITAQVLFTTHFSLLGAWTGAAMNGLAAVRTFLFYKRDAFPFFKNVLWMYVFMAVFIAAGFLTWQSWYSALPMIAMVTDTFAVWHEKPAHIRIYSIVQRPFWFAYNTLVKSYAGMTTEIFIFLSILIGILRFDILKKKN